MEFKDSNIRDIISLRIFMELFCYQIELQSKRANLGKNHREKNGHNKYLDSHEDRFI